MSPQILTVALDRIAVNAVGEGGAKLGCSACFLCPPLVMAGLQREMDELALLA